MSGIDNCFNVFSKIKAFHGIIFQVICKSVNFHFFSVPKVYNGFNTHIGVATLPCVKPIELSQTAKLWQYFEMRKYLSYVFISLWVVIVLKRTGGYRLKVPISMLRSSSGEHDQFFSEPALLMKKYSHDVTANLSYFPSCKVSHPTST